MCKTDRCGTTGVCSWSQSGNPRLSKAWSWILSCPALYHLTKQMAVFDIYWTPSYFLLSIRAFLLLIAAVSLLTSIVSFLKLQGAEMTLSLLLSGWRQRNRIRREGLILLLESLFGLFTYNMFFYLITAISILFFTSTTITYFLCSFTLFIPFSFW
jgi:hypothetical protein